MLHSGCSESFVRLAHQLLAKALPFDLASMKGFAQYLPAEMFHLTERSDRRNLEGTLQRFLFLAPLSSSTFMCEPLSRLRNEAARDLMEELSSEARCSSTATIADTTNRRISLWFSL